MRHYVFVLVEGLNTFIFTEDMLFPAFWTGENIYKKKTFSVP